MTASGDPWPLSAAATHVLRKSSAASGKPQWITEYDEVGTLAVAELIVRGAWAPVEAKVEGGPVRFERVAALPADAPFPLDVVQTAVAEAPVGTFKELRKALTKPDTGVRDATLKEQIEHRMCDDGLLERGRKTLVTREMRYRRTVQGDRLVEVSKEIEGSLKNRLPFCEDPAEANRIVQRAGSMVLVVGGGLGIVAETHARLRKKAGKLLDPALELSGFEALAAVGGVAAAMAAISVGSGAGVGGIFEGLLEGW